MMPSPSSRTPLFSVVIATYNYGHLVERAIHSVLKQTFRDFELIVVDDGSTDDTPQRLEHYAGQLRYVRKENGGQSSAYNQGAKLATGRYVYILDADDALLPDALEHFHETVTEKASNNDQIFFGGYISVSEDGKQRRRSPSPAPATKQNRVKAFIRQQIPGLQNGTFIIPTAAFDTLQYPEHLRHNTDLVFLGQALALYPAQSIGEIVMYSHEHPERSRKQLQSNLAAGLEPVEAMFAPGTMPGGLHPLKKVFQAQRLRSLARMLYLQGDYAQARQYYTHALKSHPPAMAQFSTLKRFLISIFKR